MPRSLAPQPRTREADEYLTPAEAAALTKLSVQTLANHRYRGVGIPFSKLTPGRGGRVRYRRRDVERFLNGEFAA